MADDHPQVQRQLAARLMREPDFILVGAAVDSVQTLQVANTEKPDLLLVDPMMRDGLGLATLRRIRAELPGVAVVVLTAFVDTALAIQLREMGVKRVLVKGILFSELIAELRASVK